MIFRATHPFFYGHGDALGMVAIPLGTLLYRHAFEYAIKKREAMNLNPDFHGGFRFIFEITVQELNQMIFFKFFLRIANDELTVNDHMIRN